ncbi:MAG: hypothetical protein HQL31_02855, partial [Planctomycetes bacterium]|nr:hypothetical protein [Planctomycetota bacterium]
MIPAHTAIRHLFVLAAMLLMLEGLLFCDIIFQGGNVVNQGAGAIRFDTNDDGVTEVIMMPSGNVGIGTVTPGAKLAIMGNLAVGGNIHLATIVQPPTPSAGDIYSDGSALYFYDGSSWDDMTRAGSPWASSSGNVIISSGMLGIGTTTPAANLHVVGNMLVGQEMILQDRILLADGSALSPSLSFQSDPNTGLFLASTGNIGISAGGSEVVALDGTHLQTSIDLETDRWLDSDTNFALGVGVLGDGLLAHGTGNEGWYNTALGYQAMKATSAGNRNVAVGYQALKANTTGYRNVALGYWAKKDNTTGSRNVAIGYKASAYTVAASDSVAVGAISLSQNTGSRNTAIGLNVIPWAGTGTDNTGVGATALYRISTGSYNTGFGQGACAVGTGEYNTAFGYCSMTNTNGTGRHNTTFGYEALRNDLSCNRNTNIGYMSGKTAGAKDDNTLFGYYTGMLITTGSRNTLLGYNTGASITAGSNNILIGTSISPPSAGANDHLNIGDTLYGNLDLGRVGIAVATPTATLHVNGNAYVSSEFTVSGTILPTGNASQDLGSAALAWSDVNHVDMIVLS